MTVSDTERAYGGHLEPGCRVLYLGEVRIDVLSETGFVRRPHPERGTAQLQKTCADAPAATVNDRGG
jgi:predicted DNA-binding protein with PD1-like motif